MDVAGNLLKIKKNGNKWSMPTIKTKNVQIFCEDNQKVAFHELKSILEKGFNWLHISGFMIVFGFSATGGKIHETSALFASPGKA